MNTKLYINGALVEGKGKAFQVKNPAYDREITTVQAADESQAEEALVAAQQAFKTWSFTSIDERCDWMKKLSDNVLNHREELRDIVAQEGKSYSEADKQIETFLGYMKFYAEEVRRVYDTGIPEGAGHRDSYHTIIRRPLGVVVAHLSWNSPLNLLGVKLAPSLASGCTCVLKPSTSTPLSALYIASLAEEIGFPKGVFNVVTGPSGVIGKYLNESKIPAMVSMIGSTKAGLEVMKQGATAIKKFSLELGGNAPCIIMPDSDLDVTAAWLAKRKASFAGQGCANVNRVFVHESIHDAFLEKLTNEVKKIKVGWGKDQPDAMSPLINVKTRDHVIELVRKTMDQGAKLIYGGYVKNLPEELKNGAFMLPTILDGVRDDMDIANVEIFAPVYTIFTFSTLDEVIQRANNTDSGLTSYLMSHDSRVIARCVEELEFGEVDVNMPALGPNYPHVGIKQSGIGCDRSKWSLDEYFNLRRIAIRP